MISNHGYLNHSEPNKFLLFNGEFLLVGQLLRVRIWEGGIYLGVWLLLLGTFYRSSVDGFRFMGTDTFVGRGGRPWIKLSNCVRSTTAGRYCTVSAVSTDRRPLISRWGKR